MGRKLTGKYICQTCGQTKAMEAMSQTAYKPKREFNICLSCAESNKKKEPEIHTPDVPANLFYRTSNGSFEIYLCLGSQPETLDDWKVF